MGREKEIEGVNHGKRKPGQKSEVDTEMERKAQMKNKYVYREAVRQHETRHNECVWMLGGGGLGVGACIRISAGRMQLASREKHWKRFLISPAATIIIIGIVISYVHTKVCVRLILANP